MSDTAAFLAGCAVTGVAVLFVMRNDSISQTRVPPPLQSVSPTPEILAPPVPPPPSSHWSQEEGRSFRMESELDQQRNLSRDLSDQLRRQQDRTEDLKGQLEQQQRQTEDLKSQLEKQERNTEILINQIHEQQRLLERLSDQPIRTAMPIDALTEPRSNTTDIQTIITGVVGIVVLVVVAGGGLILFAIIVVVLLSSRRRPTRTIHIVHPGPNPYPTFASQPLLPARARTRPARHIDVEYYADGNYD
ncbi:hypothetical protein [Thermocoleostomius sinensis]|uniref:Uncharacterized protein n=1 Tax=Thermocoleostomius sinensis A174 TaxID=2016057 RepID=A0A9E8ZEI2_9CYAN|nr:hypothetical protein [Thermocoleostomius sinensis]WAL61678.1 hypothetical protein OXH18_06760 [Thermocoleostomius sinensis A174]